MEPFEQAVREYAQGNATTDGDVALLESMDTVSLKEYLDRLLCGAFKEGWKAALAAQKGQAA